MLVLTRMKGEEVIIGKEIILKVIEVEPYNRDGYVKIGIEAPKDVSIKRKEDYDRGNDYQGTGVRRTNPPGGLEGSIKLNPKIE